MTSAKYLGYLAPALVAAALALAGCKQPSAEADTNAPPSITIESYNNGQMVDGLISVAGTSADDSGVSKVEVSFDGGTTYTAASGTASWQIDFDTLVVPDGNLFIKAKATDGGGYTAYAFVTLIVDNAGPGVQIISPQDGQKISGRFAVVGIGTKLDSVELSLDGGAYSTVTGNYTWYQIWDTTAETEGNHTISVRPVRNSSPGDAETITVFVDQTVPNVSFTAPAIGAYIKGAASIAGTASDNTSVARVEISTDSGLHYATASGTTSWSHSLDTLTAGPLGAPLPDGARVIYARVVDEPGLLGLASIPVTVDNNAPAVAVTSHANGAMVAGVVHLAGTASDTVGVQKVEVQFGALPIQTAEGTTSWNYDFNSAALANGSYDLTVTATDFAGNSSSTVVQLLVDQNFPAATIGVSNGAYLKGSVAVSGTVSDLDGVDDIQSVRLKIGAADWVDAASYTPGTGNWSHTIDTTVSSGPTTILVKVTDAVGGYSTLTRSVVFDNGNPVVSIASPSDGGKVAGTVLITGTVTDAISAIATLSISITDGTSGTPTRNGSYWYYQWTTGAEGSYSITVTATDMAGNTHAPSIGVEVTATVPVVAVTSHSNGAFVKGTIRFSGTATATAGIKQVDVAVDNPAAPVQASVTAPNWESQDIVTTSLSNDTHVIYVTVTDNSTPDALVTTVQLTVTVDNLPPEVHITYPTTANVGANALYGTLDITGTASDANLDTVEVSIDGGTTYAPVTGTTSWSWSWNTVATVLAADDVPLMARATDKAGNTAVTAGVAVDVHPHITSLSKTSSFVGDTIAIVGSNFAAASGITFDGVPATSKTFLDSTRFSSVTVPAGATSGDVVVTTNGLPSNGVNLNIWRIDSVPGSNNASNPSLALDASDNMYVSWTSTGGSTKYVYFNKGTYNAGTKLYSWGGTATVVDSNSGAGPQYSSIGVSGSNVYVAYWHPTGELRVAKSANGGASFTSPVLVESGGTYPSLEVYYNSTAGNDTVYVAYYLSGVLRLATSTDGGTTFSKQTLDSSADVGQFASLALDSAHSPHVAYYDATNRALKYTYWDGVSLLWRTRTIDPSFGGQYAGIAVGGDNSIHIGYYDGSYGDLDYASAAGAGSTFTLETPDAEGVTGWFASTAVDAFSAPHIAYYDYAFARIRYAEKTTGTWRLFTIPENGVITQTFTTIGIDSGGLQRVGYVGGGTLKFARYLP